LVILNGADQPRSPAAMVRLDQPGHGQGGLADRIDAQQVPVGQFPV
jgi:hypothetical protein